MASIASEHIDDENECLVIIRKDGSRQEFTGSGRYSETREAILADTRLDAHEIEVEALEEKIKTYAQHLQECSSVAIELEANDTEGAAIYFTFIDKEGVISEERLSIDKIETATAFKL